MVWDQTGRQVRHQKAVRARDRWVRGLIAGDRSKNECKRVLAWRIMWHAVNVELGLVWVGADCGDEPQVCDCRVKAGESIRAGENLGHGPEVVMPNCPLESIEFCLI